MGKVTLPHIIGGFMITYLEFPFTRNIREYSTINRGAKIYTSMSPAVSGDFIPNSNNYYLYLTKKSNTKFTFASREENDTTNSVPISPIDEHGYYGHINAIIGVENINDLGGYLSTANVVKFKTIKGTYKVKAINQITANVEHTISTFDSTFILFYYGFPCYFTVNGNLCSSITFENGDKYYRYDTTEYNIKDGYYYFENSNVANKLKYGDILNFGSGIEIPDTIYKWIMANTEVVYENIYTVNSTKGDTNYATLEEAPPMKKAKLSVLDSRKTLTLTGENDREYPIAWTSFTPADKIFLGLSVAPNSSAPLIPVGKEVPVSFNDSTALYEVYAKYKPLSTKFEIHTYKSSAEQNRVDKTNFLTADMIISGVLREASSLIHPSITFTSDIIPTFNYVYIPIFNRYYYVTDITSIKNKLWQMSLTVDVLMTYKEALLACTGYIDRNENEYNGLIPDGMISLQKGEIIETNFVTNEVFTESEGTYILQGLLVSVGDVVTDTHTGSSGDDHSGGGGNFGN